MSKSITIQTIVNASIDKVWKFWTEPSHITQWNFASDDWECPNAENDLRVGGKFKARMSAKDESSEFDFEGVYTSVVHNKLIEYSLGDERKVKVEFSTVTNGTKVIETFDMEEENSEELQRNGWQAILNNFKKHVEGNSSGNNTICQEFLKELKSEVSATRKCIERIPLQDLFEWKPHEKSMKMGYLTVLLAEMPRWIANMINVGVIDFETWRSPEVNTSEELVEIFDKNIIEAENALKNMSDSQLEETFTLKKGDHVFFTSSKRENLMSTFNHWVHHRGQLTVYMRLNNIPVPSIYGPSADDPSF